MIDVAEYVYVDTALGALNRRNVVRRLGDVDFHNGGAERYISHRRATVALLDWVNNHQNQNGNPTIEGFDGAVWDPSLPFDFDDRHDPAHALEWLRQFLDRLEREDVPLDALRISFSGAKGFHLEIPHTLFGGFEPSTELHVYEKAAAVELMHGIPFDTAVYDKLRLWRLNNTLNAKGQRYKVRLSLAEVRGLSMDEIRELALAPRPRLMTAPDEEWMPNAYLVEVWERAVSGARRQNQNGQTDSVSAASRQNQNGQVEPAWSAQREDHVFKAVLIAAIAEGWPDEAGLSRHSDYLLPLSGFLARYMGAEQAAAVLKEAALRAGDQGFLEDRTRHWEQEIERLCAGSAQKVLDEQPVEGLPTIAKHWPELAQLLSTIFIVPNTQKTAKTAKTESKGFTVTHVDDLLDEPAANVAYLTDGMLPMAGVSLWGAKPKTGKSVAVRNLAVCVARGEDFLGRACHQGPVIVLCLEEKRSEVANHLRDLGARGADIFIHTGAAPGTSKEGIAALANLIGVLQPVLVVIDPVLKLVRVRDSSDYAELTRELEPIIELARNLGCHIAVTHHLGKQLREGGDDVLGSTAIFAAVDTLVLLRRRKDNQRVLQTIQRYGSDVPETLVPMDADGRLALGPSVSELKIAEARVKIQEVLDKLSEGDSLSEPEIREQAEIDRSLAHQALKDLVDMNIAERLGEGKRGSPYKFKKASEPSNLSIFLSSPTSTQDRKIESQKPEEPVIRGLDATPMLCRLCGKELWPHEEAAGVHEDCDA